ncbi:hypothetical protein L1987_87500 [Smallanthus sonchifolius]|nr:hypothetical protein L1987_87500 [Smallanthus sonchifolius]
MLFEKEKKDYSRKVHSERNEEVLDDKTEKEHDKEFSKQSPRIESKYIVLINTPVIVSQDTMSELIELEKEATKRIEEAEKQKKKSESIHKNDGLNDPPSFRLLSQESNEENPEKQKGDTEKVSQEKEIVLVGGKEKVGEETVGEERVGEQNEKK